MDIGDKKESQIECPEVYVTFLQQVKSGEYAKMDTGTNVVTRITVQREPSYEDVNYLYSYR